MGLLENILMKRYIKEKELRHSVDSVASYSSQNHVDRIRTQNFSAASCNDEDFGSIKTSLFRRSNSNLEYPIKRPESVTSNASSTRSRLRELVERKSNQEDHKSAANTVADIQYFENPTETLEFDKSSNSLDSIKSSEVRSKKRKAAKTKESDNKANKKQEKYQSKLAEYYKVAPVQLPQDEFYQHLTRSRAAEEFLQKRFPNSDTEITGSYGRLCKHKEVEGSNLRRSRSLAVIREETFTDLQIQNHNKNKRSQLIPRARLFDKPCFKDRLIGRAKYQTKEEVLEGIYIDSTVSCFGDINGQKEEKSQKPESPDNCLDKEDFRADSRHSKSVSGSWPNLYEDSKQINLSEDSIGHSRNPSEIDSLDSNYVRKHYNFDAHLTNYKDSSPETERSGSQNTSHDLHITTDQDSEREASKTSQSPAALVANDTNRDIVTHQLETADPITENYTPLNENNTIKDNLENIQQENTCDTQSLLSENDGTISSRHDSITSYISISITSSTDRSHKLEHLANSLAEKIDEYCDSQFPENTEEHLKTNSCYQSTNNEPLYTSVNKKTTFADIKRAKSRCSENSKEENSKEIFENYRSSSNIENIKDSEEFHKNIPAEPFVTSLIENQYYSLPDINISKGLRKSERIDAQLRKEDPEDILNGTYNEQSHLKEIWCQRVNENYGQLNKININSCLENTNTINIDENFVENNKLQNCTKLEDDLKSIITVDSSNDADSNYYHSDSHQNEREINEIEGTIRNNKLITKSESIKSFVNYKNYKPQFKILKSLSNDNISKKIGEKTKTSIKKHYSLRQRDPTDDNTVRLPSPSIIEKTTKQSQAVEKLTFSEQIKNHSLLSRVQSFKTSAESHIAIVPLSGHQTIVIDPPVPPPIPPPVTNSINQNLNKGLENTIKLSTNSIIEQAKAELTGNGNISGDFTTNVIARDPFVTIKLNKVVKATIPKLKSDYSHITFVHKPPTKLILKDNETSLPNIKINNNMTRPQVLQVIDSKNRKQSNNNPESKGKIETNNKSFELCNNNKDQAREVQSDSCNTKDKLNNAIKTDIEYQEKINSVKNYWSKLIDQSPEIDSNQEDKETSSANENKFENPISVEKQRSNSHECTSEVSVGSIIKSLENVKIVDSVKKLNQIKLNLWKDETEKVKSDSEIEEKPIEKIFKEKNETIYDNPKPIKFKKKIEDDLCRDTPDIEIVELSSDDNQNQKTQATLIKAKGFEKGCDDFDHVRYKVMKSQLFKNSMIANYRKEAQFDGLLQYLQDYSFQELLVNNNIVIIEPVRTKIEPISRKTNNTDTCKIPPTLLKKNDYSYQNDKSKNAVKRHFFYHPIRVNKEIIEEELPNPDTVKKVRNLFEDTLKMKTPMNVDPPLVDENINLSRRSTSYRNLSDGTKEIKVVNKKKVTRHLTIDTNLGNKKWDNASLSSGVSSGDLSSNNDYENDGLSAYSQKNLKDNTYSSSDEYLCDSANQDLCCESQYVSPDIMKKIRECGTSVTYYGGKVLNSKTGSTVSPMTKAIMEEIKSLQKNCSRDCYSCQTKCRGDKCSCLSSDKHKQIPASKDMDSFQEAKSEESGRTEQFPSFKFKLVKSNSCSSRLELTGTDESRNPRIKFRKQNSKDDPPLVCDNENSVKNKICRLESYNRGSVKAPIQKKYNNDKNYKVETKPGKNEQTKEKIAPLSHLEQITSIHEHEDIENNTESSESRRNSIQSNKQTSELTNFEKKFYYVNDNLDQTKVTTGKFGEMVFEEFEVLESCYDSLNSNKSAV